MLTLSFNKCFPSDFSYSVQLFFSLTTQFQILEQILLRIHAGFSLKNNNNKFLVAGTLQTNAYPKQFAMFEKM